MLVTEKSNEKTSSRIQSFGFLRGISSALFISDSIRGEKSGNGR